MHTYHRPIIRTIALLVVLVFCSVRASTLTAQTRVSLPVAAGPGTLTGLVVDSLGVPVGGATVFIVDPTRQARSSSAGTFRFDSLKTGKYTIGARAMGYVGSTGRVEVGAQGGTVVLQLLKVAQGLASVVTTASRGGLSGVIGDTAFAALSNVRVQVMGSSLPIATTDSTGAFFIPVKAGQYMVRLDRPGYARQLIAVTIPDTAGRQIAAWMAPQNGKVNPLEGANLFELNRRLVWRSDRNSHVYTRDELRALDISDLEVAAERFLGVPLDGRSCAFIDGGPNWAPLWTFNSEEIELFEVYGERGARSSRTNIMDNTRIGQGKDTGRVSCAHFVWLRK